MLTPTAPSHSPAEAAIVAALTAAVAALRAGCRTPATPATVAACRRLARRTGDMALSELVGAHSELALRAARVAA